MIIKTILAIAIFLISSFSLAEQKTIYCKLESVGQVNEWSENIDQGTYQFCLNIIGDFGETSSQIQGSYVTNTNETFHIATLSLNTLTSDGSIIHTGLKQEVIDASKFSIMYNNGSLSASLSCNIK